MVHIRAIEEKDNDTIGRIVQESLEEAGLAVLGTAYFDPHLFSLSQYYCQPDRQYWVMEKDGEVIGGIGVGPFDVKEKIGEIQKLYVTQKERGQGLAHPLMRQALTYAEKHYSRLYIETFASLSAANALYKAYGFKKLDAPFEGTEHSACDTWLIREL